MIISYNLICNMHLEGLYETSKLTKHLGFLLLFFYLSLQG